MSGGRYDDGHWRRYAACRANDPDLFFPASAFGPYVEQNDKAKAVCSGCPVRIACLRFALATNQQFGIWGGLNEDERRDIRRQWRRSSVDDEMEVNPTSAAS